MATQAKKPPSNNLFVLFVLALVLACALVYWNPTAAVVHEVPISTLQEAYRAGDIKTLQIENNTLTAILNNDQTEMATIPTRESLSTLGFNDPASKTVLQAKSTDTNDFWMQVLAGVIPFILIAVFLMYMMRQAQNSSQGALSFGQSRARVSDKTKNKTTFQDVAGARESKEELKEIVDFLKEPKKYLAMGAKIPKGVLLIGPPGTGKTLLARAVAGEADVPFFSISGSEFVEMFVGVGASRVRDLFAKAKRNAPAIIFIDEIDAVGRQRGAGLGGGHDEREQTLNQILTEMDGFETGANVIIIAATNRPDVLDPALLRPGRFDRRVVIDAPDLQEREEILAVHAKNKPMDGTVNLHKVARSTPGLTGADLENILNEAAIFAARNDKKELTQKDMEHAIEKVALGPERKNRVLNTKEREITAYHEVGHAIAGHVLPHCDPIHKVTIVSRGMALGVTWSMPEEDRRLVSEARFQDELSSLLGGRVAEELMFASVTTGASNDLERATAIARNMVTEYGMSRLGHATYGQKHGSVFLGRELAEQRNYSEETARKIDDEVKRIVDAAYQRTTKLLTQHKAKLVKISKMLIEQETLTSEEFTKLFGAKKAKSATI